MHAYLTEGGRLRGASTTRGIQCNLLDRNLSGTSTKFSSSENGEKPLEVKQKERVFHSRNGKDQSMVFCFLVWMACDNIFLSISAKVALVISIS